MALDGKTIIKEEITDKDAYEAAAASAANSTRRNKATSNSSSSSKDSTITTNSNGSNSNSGTNPNGGSSSNSRSCRTPDSPESARAVAPRSPMSPQLHQHHSSLAPPPRPNRNASASPVINGATTTPPPPPQQSQAAANAQTTQAAVAAAAAAAAHVEQARLLGKIRKFLGSLVQLAQDVHPEVSDRVRALVISLASGGISIDEFRMALQEAINLPLRPYVIPLLKNHISLLQREIAALARATNQTTLQYVTSNESTVMEFSPHGPPAEYSDIFVQLDGQSNGSGAGATSLVFKRRPSDTLMEPHGHNGAQEWSDYMAAYPPPKRLHAHNPHAPAPESRIPFASAQPTIFDYSATGVAAAQSEGSFNNLMEKASHRDDRDIRSSVPQEPPAHRPLARNVMPAASSGPGGGAPGGSGPMQGEEEWKNIHTMLNCISAMVDKTKRAITILQQRGVEPQQPSYGEVTPATLMEIRRQTEEKVAEFKRNAEDAVNQVKRQAVIEIQRAVVAAETRAAEVMAQERLRMEKFFVEMSRHSGSERELDNKSPSIGASQNACWNCGRKATETCSGCNLARYCGAFCQHKDWEHHHQICGTTRTTDLSTKHPSQVIPLSATIRGAVTRSPPTPVQTTGHGPAQSSQATSSASSAPQPSSLVANGIGSK
ncbi:protein CBFA2T2 [Musca vetustissima]|uniref:protein CBFA2T2 n=1 Tax=Musca vetustissima TaxID=27455 RepID=UPI002AB66E22|nr:protein CBFA2T2 [Musca vetustissima]